MEKKSNNFLDGFFWGALIGGGAIFFLGTEKGKKLLKIFTQEGTTGASKLEEIFQTYKGIYKGEEEHENTPPRKKNFFKGLPRKHNG